MNRIFLTVFVRKNFSLSPSFYYDENFYRFLVRIYWLYLPNNNMNDSFYFRFLGHNHYVGEMAEWLKA